MKHLAAVSAAVILSIYCNATAQEKVAVETQDFVTAEFDLPIASLRALLLLQFDSEERSFFEDYNRAIYDLPEKVLSYKNLSPKAYEKFMDFPMIKPTKFYVFLGAYPTQQSRLMQIEPEDVVGKDNPALARYAELPLESREMDIYLWSPDSPYWYSEYQWRDKPAPFRSYFILHLEAKGKHRSTLEVIEENPVVRMEGKLHVDEHGSLQPYEVRSVSPTTRDRTYLMGCIRQFAHYNYASRKEFTCDEKAFSKP